ncbi:hypothetical protein CI109_106780 [Kwoniella shandongensis]|uniref:Uncharacterized protein n=1 Tax=Kwoniella shandongensis TaxID=1734106 RepID=A0A5M6C6N2_9TREE|nr:uncharacterized protein CI109_000964 [Kwoniella shandongensis]KAA5530784.1 hypothetical protein CI109_000964 [Kwoniella shandongensis]
MAPPATATTAGPSKGKNKALATTHDESKTIRAQSKKDKSAPKQDVASIVDRAGMNKDVVKAVLASPLTTSWPNIPRHLQTAVLHALKEVVPEQIADYHVSRARCHTKERRVDRRMKKKSKKEDNGDESKEGDLSAVENKIEDRSEDVSMTAGDDTATGAGTKRKSTTPSSKAEPIAKKQRTENGSNENTTKRPVKPESLSHLVLGINEVIKSLESQIDEIKLRLLVMADALAPNPVTNGHATRSAGHPAVAANGLLPTAPLSPNTSPEPITVNQDQHHTTTSDTSNTSSSSSPLSFIVVPLLSINPQSLVYPIPSYCATYNALVYQHAQFAKIVKTRLKASEWEDVIGKEEREEVRVVPLGEVEKDMAQLVGLRRLACLGVRTSHPDVEVLRKLLPKSVLHPPRHSITLPFPTSSLKIHNGAMTSDKTPTTTGVPIPNVHYAPLHVKGIQTTLPVDNAARKAKRLEEVRKRRVEVKVLKKQQKAQGTGKTKGKASQSSKGKVDATK